MKRLFRILLSLMVGYLIITLITPYNLFLQKRSIKNQITYIQSKMELGEDNVIQRRFPEGKIFSNALFALSIINSNEDVV